LFTPRFRERLRYWFDNTMSKGTPALIGWLGLASVVLVVLVTGLAFWLAPRETEDNLGRALWITLMRAMDPGTVAGDAGGRTFLTLMLLATIGGIFIVSALVGVLTAGLENKLDELRKGRSKVVETGHTVILGWSDQVFTIVPELVKAQASGRRSCIAILADRDKIEMESELRERTGATGRTRVVCRTGSPTRPADLDIVNPGGARAIVVLSPPSGDPDTHVIKTLLSIANRLPAGSRPPIVAAITRGQNLAAARIAGGPTAQIVDTNDVTSRLIVQSSRQSGVSVVCMDLLDFDGDEIYMRADEPLVGMRYGDALHAYESGVLIGLRHADGRVALNPPMDTVIGPGDQALVIAADDSLVRLGEERPPVDETAIVPPVARRPECERTLVLGWNERGPKVVRQLDSYVTAGSVIDVMAEETRGATELALERLAVNAKECDITDRHVLEALGIGLYDHVIVLSDERLDPDHADSRTLVTLLHLRDIEAELHDGFAIVSEMNDEGNRRLAEVAKADDFVVSDRLISLLLTQLAENRHLAAVFAQLFDSTGSEIYLRPVSDYVRADGPVTFATLTEAARRRGETAIGYRLARDYHTPPDYGVVLNPEKAAAIAYGPADRLIVLAEE
jgi:Trk K+ transport system NAD-binding subunit